MTVTERPAVRFYDQHPALASLREAVLEGLAARPKTIPPKFFYDERGSRLFDAITELPEYYPTRTEIGLLERHAGEIAALTGPRCLLVELGSGSSRKVRILLEGLEPRAYVPLDISREHLRHSATTLAAEHPGLQVHAVCTDYSTLRQLPFNAAGCPKLLFFPGSSIGNMDPDEARAFLRRMGGLAGPDGSLLIGVDLKKDPALLHAAYNDGQGVTAAFNRNLLVRINRELDAGFDLDAFRHRAFYNDEAGRVEMHLVSSTAQQVAVDGAQFAFAEGETIHTENSYKYAVDEFRSLAREAGLSPVHHWVDNRNLFSLHFLRTR